MKKQRTETENKETIKWDEDGQSGYIITKTLTGESSSLFYKTNKGIKTEIANYLCCIVDTPFWNEQQKRYTFNSLNRIRPALHYSDMEVIKEDIRNICQKSLYEYIKNKQLTDSTLTDFEFLALLGIKKDWKTGCIVCMKEVNKGVCCNCSYTQIVVFRPCGHNVCLNTCYEKLENYYEKNKKNKISCYECNMEIKKMFRAENVHLGENKEMLDKILNDFDILKVERD